MEKQVLKDVVMQMYQARLGNNADKCAEFFTIDADFVVAGLDEYLRGGQGLPAPSACEQINGLVATWQWKDQGKLEIIIDGNKAAVAYTLKAVHIDSDIEVETQICDVLMVDENCKIAKFTQYLDTQKVGEMMGLFVTRPELNSDKGLIR